MRTMLALVLAAFPRRFRRRFGDGMLDLMQRDYARARARGRMRALFFLTAAVATTLADGLSERVSPTWIDPGLPSRGWRWKVTRLIESWTRDFVHAARSVPGLEDIAFYGTGSSTTTAEGQVDQLFFTEATTSFFTTLGAEPHLGRLPSEGDDDSVVVLSHWLWTAPGSRP